MHDEEGRVIGHHLFVRDISKNRQIGFSLAESERLAFVGRMASGIGHEINNPLAIIHGHAAHLVNMADDGALNVDEIKRTATRIEDVSLRIARVVKGSGSLLEATTT